MTGASYRQLDYWARSGRIPGQPSGAGTGSGRLRVWTTGDVERVVVLMKASRLINATLDEMVEILEEDDEQPATAAGLRALG